MNYKPAYNLYWPAEHRPSRRKGIPKCVDETHQYLMPLKSKNSLIILLLVVRKKKNKKRRKKTAGGAKAFIVRHFFCAHWSLLDVSSVVMDCNSTAKVVTTISHKKVHEWVVVCRSIFKHRSVRVLHRNAGFMYRQNHCSPVKLTYPNFYLHLELQTEILLKNPLYVSGLRGRNL